jgi:hypothetical protein
LHLDPSNPEHEIVLQFIERFGSKIVSAVLLKQLVTVSKKCLAEGVTITDLELEFHPTAESAQSTP